MTDANQIRADDEPDLCPECGSSTFTLQEESMDYHGCRMGTGRSVWRCTGCKWGVFA